eukprot:16437598-Heterocapsa_arctica.AAC.1
MPGSAPGVPPLAAPSGQREPRALPDALAEHREAVLGAQVNAALVRSAPNAGALGGAPPPGQ